MINLLKLTALLSFFLFIGCKKDEPTSNSCKFESSTFIGKWKMTKVEYMGVDITNAYFLADPCQKTLVIDFKSNGIASQSNVNNCSIEEDRSWRVFSANGRNYIVLYDAMDSDTSEISDFNCKSFTSITDNKYTATKL